MRDVAAAGRVPDRPGREGARGVELRERARAGLRRAAGGRPGFVALACALYVVAAAGRDGAGDRPRPVELHGRAERPDTARRRRATTCRPGYRLWLAGHQLEHGRRRGSTRTRSGPRRSRQANAAWWPFGLPYWPLVRALGAGARVERSSRSSACSPPARSRCSGSASSASRAWPPPPAGSRSRSRPTAWRRAAATCSGRSRCCSRSRSGHSSAPARTGDQRWWWLSARRARLDPALRPGPPRARRDPVLRPVRRLPHARAGASSSRRRSAPRRPCSPGC